VEALRKICKDNRPPGPNCGVQCDHINAHTIFVRTATSWKTEKQMEQLRGGSCCIRHRLWVSGLGNPEFFYLICRNSVFVTQKTHCLTYEGQPG
jgi:hypothetical protein